MSNGDLLPVFVKSFLTALRALWPLVALVVLVWVGCAAVWLHRQRRLHRSGINEIDRMSGLEFERYLEWLFRKLGYGVERTPDIRATSARTFW